ncbi:MAG: MBL fold metallo-hydrolase [Patescibacteria group bacterium]|mgnify:FL=1
MVITYFGGGSFRVQSGEISLLIDSENNRLKADLSLRTIASANSLLSEERSEISFPGEYEVKGIDVKGIDVPEESTEKLIKTIYLITWEEIKIAFLGQISKQPSAEIIEKLNEPNILFLPVGGGNVLEPEIAAKVAKMLEPAIIIPSFYKNPSEFLKAMGQKMDVQEKIVLKKKDLLEEKNKVVVLKQS